MTETAATTTPAAPPSAVAALKKFAARHGGSATAVIEYVGRRGARIVLVGGDGTWGDLMVADVDTAKAACEAAGVTVIDGWPREVSEAIRTSGYEWGLMGRGRPVRSR